MTDDPTKVGGTPEDAPPVENNRNPEKGPVGANPNAPIRLREALFVSRVNALPMEFWQGVLRWANNNANQFTVGGDGSGRYNYEVLDCHRRIDLRDFHRVVGEFASDSLEALNVEPFDFDRIEAHLTLYHNGSFFEFHDDTPGPEGERISSRRVTFCYYMNVPPVMFSGGRLEFLDGTAIEPVNNTLHLFNPLQRHRVTPVQCMSGDTMHGRFAITGWIHAREPLRHYAFHADASRDGACDPKHAGGVLVDWPQDVTCLDCAADIRAMLADYSRNPMTNEMLERIRLERACKADANS